MIDKKAQQKRCEALAIAKDIHEFAEGRVSDKVYCTHAGDDESPSFWAAIQVLTSGYGYKLVEKTDLTIVLERR